MLALSHSSFSNNIGFWQQEEALIIGHDQHNNHNYFYGATSSPTQSFTPSQPSDIFRSEPTPTNSGGDVKKLNHNASERDRRKKINHLYSSLRNLLPSSNHSKKMSIPNTVSRAIKYIPELQQEVEGLVRKRDELLLKKQRNVQVKQEMIHNGIKSTFPSSLSSVSASQLNSREIAVQISTFDNKTDNLSDSLRDFENDGFSVLNASSFESFGGRVFHNLHLQVEGSCSAFKCRSIGSYVNPCIL